MRQIRFYVPFNLRVGEKFTLPEDKSRHIAQVLRLGVGAEFLLFNGDGQEYAVKIIALSKKTVEVQINSADAVSRESNIQIDVIQSLSKGDKMDVTIQKCVELGVNLICPVSTSRSNFRINETRMAKKLSHWCGIIHSACEQSGRNVIPELLPAIRFESALEKYSDFNGLKIILHPSAKRTLFQFEGRPDEVALLVGPEGGFSEDELDLAQQSGFEAVSLGPRVLRTETAALTVIAGIQAKWGDF